jgi:pSer/pThr/pTyr-binding forkhead associated (FHA) protein
VRLAWLGRSVGPENPIFRCSGKQDVSRRHCLFALETSP